MDKQDENTSKATGVEGGPMATGMTMAKKMMGQIGQGGNPMEMMQKMMAQMSHREGKPPMEKMMGMCMGMCAEMLTALKQTNALAVFGTPELHAAFSDWLKAYEDKALVVLTQGQKDAAGLASALQIGEESAGYILSHLAASGKISLTGKVNS